ncbi:YkoF family thiamine/hydroxymethylpyrimidine-binding protein [Paraburkholderia hospita]|uniref:YkoF family thiamine/hydroxymethylpyrimidine-binding protein n=1 Tax=Paraburkholderia hospita TaxID=169430 RepID=UPI003F4F81D9
MGHPATPATVIRSRRRHLFDALSMVCRQAADPQRHAYSSLISSVGSPSTTSA